METQGNYRLDRLRVNVPGLFRRSRGRNDGNWAMEPYWSYEDIGVFLFVLVFLAAAVGLSVRVLFLRPSELVTPSLALQNFVIIFLSVSLYLILKWRHHRPGDCAFGMGWPRMSSTALSDRLPA